MRISDWSSDVCSSDLWPPPTASRGTDPRGAARCGWPNQLVTAHRPTIVVGDAMRAAAIGGLTRTPVDHPAALTIVVEHLHAIARRSEERRVGKECASTCSSWWAPSH